MTPAPSFSFYKTSFLFYQLRTKIYIFSAYAKNVVAFGKHRSVYIHFIHTSYLISRLLDEQSPIVSKILTSNRLSVTFSTETITLSATGLG